MNQIIDVAGFKNYIYSETIKNKIILHGTAGSTYAGALQTFVTGAKGVSTHFIIGQDAKIYRLFPEKNFAYHAGADFRTISQTSIGIQIVNWVNLKKIRNDYYSWTNKRIDPKQVVTTKTWRQNTYWHAITPQQQASISFLLKYLCQGHGIKKEFHREYNPELFNTKQFNGILMHSSFHPTRLDFQPSIIGKISI